MILFITFFNLFITLFSVNLLNDLRPLGWDNIAVRSVAQVAARSGGCALESNVARVRAHPAHSMARWTPEKSRAQPAPRC